MKIQIIAVAILLSFVSAKLAYGGEPIQPSAIRQNWQDLEVITLDSQGNPAKTTYYSYDQLLTLPVVTVKTERDPNTNTPATYTGI